MRPLHCGFEVESIFMRVAPAERVWFYGKTFSSSAVTLADPIICCGRERRASRRDREKDQIQVAALALSDGQKHGTYFFCQLPLL